MSTTSTTAAKAENSIGQVQFLTITALFIALTYVFTAFVNVRLPITANGGLVTMNDITMLCNTPTSRMPVMKVTVLLMKLY